MMVEAREFQNDVQKTLRDMSHKVEEVHRAVQGFSGRAGKDSAFGATAMTPILIVQAVQKMLEENEVLKREIQDKTEKIDILREQITQLHAKNDQFIDQHNRIQEQRADTLKESAELARRNLMSVRDQKTKLEIELNEVLLHNYFTASLMSCERFF